MKNFNWTRNFQISRKKRTLTVRETKKVKIFKVIDEWWNYHQFRGKFCIEFVLQGQPRGRSRWGQWSATEAREAKSQSDPPLNYEREREHAVENLSEMPLQLWIHDEKSKTLISNILSLSLSLSLSLGEKIQRLSGVWWHDER